MDPAEVQACKKRLCLSRKRRKLSTGAGAVCQEECFDTLPLNYQNTFSVSSSFSSDNQVTVAQGARTRARKKLLTWDCSQTVGQVANNISIESVGTSPEPVEVIEIDPDKPQATCSSPHTLPAATVTCSEATQTSIRGQAAPETLVQEQPLKLDVLTTCQTNHSPSCSREPHPGGLDAAVSEAESTSGVCGEPEHPLLSSAHQSVPTDNMNEEDYIFTDAELMEALDKVDTNDHSPVVGSSSLSPSPVVMTTPTVTTRQRHGRYQRHCPLFKWIPGTSITVDAFSYGSIPHCSAYFLSHYHSDHYQGLTRHFQHDIYCSRETANLVVSLLKVNPSLVHALPLDTPITVQGAQVLLLPANHCPGSVMFLYTLPNGVQHLHTGDFRVCKSMQQCPHLIKCSVDTLFLDTTYCSSKYDFPTQESVVQFAVDRTLQVLSSKPATLIVCGTYTIGKEKIFLAIAEVLSCRAFVTKEKKKILDCLESEQVSQFITSSSPSATPLHVVPMSKLTMEGLEQYMASFKGRYSGVLAFRPTGWTYSSKLTNLSAIRPSTRGSVTIYGIPYSEHSSFSELREMVQFLRPRNILSTVGGASARRAAESQCKQWLSNTHARRDTKVQTTLDHLIIKSST